MVFQRQIRVLGAAFIRLIGLGGSIAVAWGINMMSSVASGKIPLLAWAFLICGALACTGGIIPLLYVLLRDYRAKLAIRVTDARLRMTELEPGLSRWELEVYVNVNPPKGHELVIQADHITARLINSRTQLLIGNMAIGPMANLAAMSAELTIGRQKDYLCEGAAVLDIIAQNIPLNPPHSFPCQFNMENTTGEWKASASFELVASSDNEWCISPRA